jgi:hypothetical protein
MASRVRVAFTLVFDAAFWILAVWAPIAVIAFGVYKHYILLALVGCVACVAAAVGARLLARGIWSGHRLAYVLVCLMLLSAAGYHTWQALHEPSPAKILAATRALAYVGLTVAVGRGARGA